MNNQKPKYFYHNTAPPLMNHVSLNNINELNNFTNNLDTFIINEPRNYIMSYSKITQQHPISFLLKQPIHYCEPIKPSYFNHESKNSTSSLNSIDRGSTILNLPTLSSIKNIRQDTAFNHITNNTITNNFNNVNQILAPISPSYYQREDNDINNHSANCTISSDNTVYSQPINSVVRGNLIYPLTPQSLDSQSFQSPIKISSTNKFKDLKNSKDQLLDNDYENEDEKKKNNNTNYNTNDDDDDESKQYYMYYDKNTKEYVFKTENEAQEGTLNGSLIKYEQNKKRKKLSNDDNESDDESDYDDKKSNNINTIISNNKNKKRSRNGCLTCRNRKKRCCETKPICSECTRLNIICRWPFPGDEHKNKSKNRQSISNDEVYHEVYGVIKVLRGVVEYKIEE
jgi:hypothetical protein